MSVPVITPEQAKVWEHWYWGTVRLLMGEAVHKLQTLCDGI